MRTVEDLREELARAFENKLWYPTFKVPTLDVGQRIALDEKCPAYYAAIDHLYQHQIPLTWNGGAHLVAVVLDDAPVTMLAAEKVTAQRNRSWRLSAVETLHAYQGMRCVDRALQEAAQKAFAEVMAQREEICRAFLAKYGCPPDEIEQVEQTTGDERRWFLRRRPV